MSKKTNVVKFDELPPLLERLRLEAIKLELTEAEQERRLEGVRQEYATDIAEREARVKNLRKQIEATLQANKEKFDNPSRSMRLRAGVVGFQKGQPHLKPLAKWTWAKVLDVLTARRLRKYYRTTYKVDKPAIMRDRKKLTLSDFGLRVAQKDEPYIIINREPREEDINAEK